MLYLLRSGKAALMSALSRPHIRGWSQRCLKEWDHFSIDCRVGQCKGHLLWQSGRCCLSACLPVYRPACLSAFILASLSACSSLCALIRAIPKRWWTGLRLVIVFSTFGLFMDVSFYTYPKPTLQNQTIQHENIIYEYIYICEYNMSCNKWNRYTQNALRYFQYFHFQV